MSERAITCRCGKYNRRDQIKLAHVIPGVHSFGWTTCEIYGLFCETCGVNWQPFSQACNPGSCEDCHYAIEDFSESEAEVAFYEQYLTSMYVFKPQVYLPFSDSNAFFVDFVDFTLHIGIEIDGKTHKGQEERDAARDKLIYDLYGIKITRFHVRRGLMFEHYRGPYLDFVA